MDSAKVRVHIDPVLNLLAKANIRQFGVYLSFGYLKKIILLFAVVVDVVVGGMAFVEGVVDDEVAVGHAGDSRHFM